MRSFWKLFMQHSPGRHRNGIVVAAPRESQKALSESRERLERDQRETIVPLQHVLRENHITERFRREIREAIIERGEDRYGRHDSAN